MILAAGIGSRFKSNIPKSLSQLNDQLTVLAYQINSLTKRIGTENILIVVGYKKNLIEKKFPKITCIHNKNYFSTNTSKSLLLALEKIDDDVLCLAGDVYFDEEILDLMLEKKQTSCLVDNKKCGAEEMKYYVDQNGFIEELSKVVKNPQGEALGMDLILKKDLDLFRSELKNLNDQDYFSKGLENLIKNKKISLLPVNVGTLFCQEFDYPTDFEKIKKYLEKIKD